MCADAAPEVQDSFAILQFADCLWIAAPRAQVRSFGRALPFAFRVAKGARTRLSPGSAAARRAATARSLLLGCDATIRLSNCGLYRLGVHARPPGDLRRPCPYRRGKLRKDARPPRLARRPAATVCVQRHTSPSYEWNAGDRTSPSQPGVSHDGHHSVTDAESRGGRHVTCTRRRSAHLLRGPRTVGHKCLLRTRCRGEVRRGHGMRVWVGRGDTGGQEVSVLRVTPCLVIV
jgi:hypothetical protein